LFSYESVSTILPENLSNIGVNFK